MVKTCENSMVFHCRCSHRHQSVVPVDIIIEPCETITILSIMIYITMHYIYISYEPYPSWWYYPSWPSCYPSLHVCMYVCIYIYIYINISIHRNHLHTHIYIYIYIYIETIDGHIIVKIMVRSWSIDAFRRIWVVKRWWTSPAKRRVQRMRLLLLGWFTPITLWLCQNSYWKWPFIVSFPKIFKNGGSFHSYVSLPEGITCINEL